MASVNQVILTDQENNSSTLENYNRDFVVIHSGAGTFQLQTSHDGSTWFDVGAAISSNGKTDITGTLLAHVRANVTAGSPVATLLFRTGKG